MAGTLPLALVQQFDANGDPLVGALVYFFVVGTVATPQDTYQDIGLSVLNPWPLETDQYGRVPNFYLADGQVHVRLTDADGVSIIDIAAMQVVGPSSGGGGGGGSSVDPTSVMATGDFKWRPTTEVIGGWVRANAQTIGSTGSGASQRANADTQALYVYLWGNFSDAHCPVAGGRGASALADFNANKPIALPDLRGRSPFGLDDMGGAAAGRLANVTSSGDTVTTPAATGGEANHTLSATEMPSHTHAPTLTDPGHHHQYAVGGQTGGGYADISNGFKFNSDTSTNTTGITVAIANTGGGGSHNNMTPFILGTWYVKL